MGLNRKWTQEEIDYLSDHWGEKSIPLIAKHLDRSVNAIQLKAGRIGLQCHIHSGSRITLFQFCEAIGKRNSYSHIKDRWVRFGFPIHYQKTISMKYAMVDIEEFWTWAERHKDMVDFDAFPEGTFGKEPEWVKEARHAKWLSKKSKAPWTDSEDQKLIRLLESYKYTYNDLCIKMNRTEGAIRKRILSLGLLARPVRNYDKQWQDSEVDTLLTMKAAGYGWEEIGRKLHRSGSAVRGKYERLQNPEYCKRLFRRNREALQNYFQKDLCVHFQKGMGCDLHNDNCDICSNFVRRTQGEPARSGWIKYHDKPADQLLKEREEKHEQEHQATAATGSH